MRLKRKDLDEDFSDFSISSPATKIRRLDAELPPIMESETPIPASVPVIEEANENQERALVVFNPNSIITSPLSSSHRFSVNSDIIAGFKNNYPWSQRSPFKISEIEEEEEEGQDVSCTAVVPWVAPAPQPWNICQQADEEMGEADMDIEEEYTNNTTSTAATMVDGYTTVSGWQHCLIPQFPQNTPLTWYQYQ